ncbi:MAG: hypothetical protein H0T78_02395 [Longispora sp.]|nr:hypothetical protein [Longispora sp. (in: high G+C Gram-positive bacteria)]
MNVESGSNAHRWAEVAAANLKRSSAVCDSFQLLGITDLTVNGSPASKLEYTCGSGDQLRYGQWCGVLSNRKVYTFYVTGPSSRAAESAPIYEELQRSFRFG